MCTVYFTISLIKKILEMVPQQDHALFLFSFFTRNTAVAISVSKFRWFLYTTDALSKVVSHLVQQIVYWKVQPPWPKHYAICCLIVLKIGLTSNTLLTEYISVYTVREHRMFSLHVCVAGNESVQWRKLPIYCSPPLLGPMTTRGSFIR